MLGLLLERKRFKFGKSGSTMFEILMRWFKGLMFCGLWYGSICSGFLLLYCPLLPLLLVHQRLFRKLTDIIFAAWEIYPAALMECLVGTRIIVSGDVIRPQDSALIVMNHRTRLDWNFLWAAMFHACQPLAHRLKIVLKASIRHVPGPGWVMQMACFLYIHRRWERDKALLARTLDYFKDIGHTCQILLFPEGTDLTVSNLQKSHRFAATHHLERYYRVLHPKTTGFVFLAQRMQQNDQLDAIYDITVGYPKTLPQNEIELGMGIFPEEVHFNIKRIPGTSIPMEEDALKEWLADRWKTKEEILGRFYALGRFETDPRHSTKAGDCCCPVLNGSTILDPHLLASHYQNSLSYKACSNESPLESLCNSHHHVSSLAHNFNHFNPSLYSSHLNEPVHSNSLYLALMFWTLLCFLALYGIVMVYTIQIWAAVNILLFLCLSVFTEGINQLEVSLYRFKMRYLINNHPKAKNF